MKALRVKERTANIADVARPDYQGEALVRVTKSGLCNTDIEIVRGYAGFDGTIGHEFVGVVESCESVAGLVGKRVVGEINVGCGVCALCMGGDPRHCPTRTVLGIHGRDGAHAEFLSLPARNLIEVPDAVSDESAVFAEPLAAAQGIAERVSIDPGSRIAVIGDGKLGLLCAMSLKLSSDSVTLIGRHKEKLAIAGKRGIEGVAADNAEALKKSFDIVVEASGSESGFAAAMDLVKPRGTIVLKSTFHGDPRWDAARVVVDEISVVGSRCGRLAPAIELLASKRVQVDDLISEEFPLADGVSALRAAEAKGILKVLLRP
ncbi:MAG TPA: alcohol dehydrogenase catalytic domain-containing protein [Pyrinomonadaceae bacterium]|nr:alcohol dehydrogenase catalytic domain-containing protein [Pyrinomonadaceae bacterium]